MIQYEKHILDNGLTVITHKDCSTPLVTVNILYKVGARNEHPTLTGFAHLFEHLMFGGSPNFPDYDFVVNGLGGESNAFTNNDYTNYYLTVPAEGLEQALRLEADRMRTLAFSEETLRLQQSVVTEEYHQRYMNQPYGDVWLLLRPLCYRVHPYRWCTIGSSIKHVQQASLEDVRQFFNRFYHPSNAIMSIAGNLDHEDALRKVRDAFGDIPDRITPACPIPQEPVQHASRSLRIKRDVPASALYKAYSMCDRFNHDYYVYDLISDILSNGNSSRLYNKLVKQQRLFSELNAYITGDLDAGLFVVSGKLCDGVDMKDAESAVERELQALATEAVSKAELQKVVNKYESTFVFSQYKNADRALSLCYYEMIGHIDWVNGEPENYRTVTPADIQRVAQATFQTQRCNTLYYEAENSYKV